MSVSAVRHREQFPDPESPHERELKRPRLSSPDDMRKDGHSSLSEYNDQTVRDLASPTLRGPETLASPAHSWRSSRSRSRSPSFTRFGQDPLQQSESLIVSSPAPSYLSMANKSPSRSTSAPRKLVIFDLNGTLLRRSDRISASARRTPGPALRTVYPRPYLPTLKEYLFHPKTKEWLDTMVWSSAQPGSVRDMVAKTFGGEEVEEKQDPVTSKWVITPKNLLAVWSRDTLGLSQAEYHSKTQTVKDLSKPWGKLPISPNTSSPGAAESTRVASRFERRKHSALSTVLVDDTRAKAVLQPFNHLCVNEYDVIAWRDSKLAKRKAELLAIADSRSPSVSSSPAPETSRVLSNKRLHAQEAKKARAESREKEILQTDAKMDRCLLALVGILDKLREEENVAAWMRSGGLLPPNAVPERGATEPPDSQDPDALYGDSSIPGFSDAPADSPPSVQVIPKTVAEPATLEGDASIPGFDLTEPEPAPPPDIIPPVPSLTDFLASHRARIRSATPTTPPGLDFVEETPPPDDAPPKLEGAAERMWFEDEDVVEYWCEEGKAALAELGIELVDGVVANLD